MGTLEGYIEGMINLSGGGGGGGTSDYEELDNKPSINNVTLSGNKTTSDLNLSYNDLLNKPYINNMPPSTGADIGDVLTHTSEGDNWEAPAKELPVITAGDEGKLLKVSSGAASWGNVASNINYSANEQVIGTWIDGKPLYQKTFTISGSYQGNSTINVSSYIDSSYNIVQVDGIGKYTTTSGDNYYALNTSIFVYPQASFNSLKLNWGSSTLPVEINITIRYTKNTD